MTTTRNDSGHTQRDFDALIEAGIDPASTQERYQPTHCWCGRKTSHQAGGCEAHYRQPAAIVKKVAELTLQET